MCQNHAPTISKKRIVRSTTSHVAHCLELNNVHQKQPRIKIRQVEWERTRSFLCWGRGRWSGWTSYPTPTGSKLVKRHCDGSLKFTLWHNRSDNFVAVHSLNAPTIWSTLYKSTVENQRLVMKKRGRRICDLYPKSQAKLLSAFISWKIS